MTFSELDSLKRHQQRATDFIISELPDMFRSSMLDADVETESPIEAIFSLWWTALSFVDFMCVRDLELDAQYNQFIGEQNYRLDFAITPRDTDLWMHAFEAGIPYQRIGVELDGHDFHERTKEQVELRNRRDRDLQNEGWRVFHFSGSERTCSKAASSSGVGNGAIRSSCLCAMIVCVGGCWAGCRGLFRLDKFVVQTAEPARRLSFVDGVTEISADEPPIGGFREDGHFARGRISESSEAPEYACLDQRPHVGFVRTPFYHDSILCTEQGASAIRTEPFTELLAGSAFLGIFQGICASTN